MQTAEQSRAEPSGRSSIAAASLTALAHQSWLLFVSRYCSSSIDDCGRRGWCRTAVVSGAVYEMRSTRSWTASVYQRSGVCVCVCVCGLVSKLQRIAARLVAMIAYTVRVHPWALNQPLCCSAVQCTLKQHAIINNASATCLTPCMFHRSIINGCVNRSMY